MRLVATFSALAVACIALAAPTSQRVSRVEPRAGLDKRSKSGSDLRFGLLNAGSDLLGNVKPGSYLDTAIPPVPPKRYYVLCDRNVTFRASQHVGYLEDCKKLRNNYLADPEAPMYWLYDENRRGNGLVVATYGHCQFKLKYYRHRSFYFGNQDLVDIIGEAVNRQTNYGTIGSCANHDPYDELDREHWAKEIYWTLGWLEEPVTLPDLPPHIGTGPNDIAAVPAWLSPQPPG